MTARIWLPPSILAAMEVEADRTFPLETGGMLVGYWSAGDAVVTDVIGPGPRADHQRFMFTADGDWQNEKLWRVYEASGRVHTYLGDWHSHPGGVAVMSALDLETMHKVAATPDARAPYVVTVILAGSHPWIVGAWHADCGRAVAMDLARAAA